MTHKKLTAETVRATRDILSSARSEIDAELLRLYPGDSRAQYRALDLPLRMTIHLDVDDRDVPTQTLAAETVRGAKDVLTSALEQIQAARLRSYPGDYDAQHRVLDEPMRTWIHFDLTDLDREDAPSTSERLRSPHEDIPKGLPPSADRRPGVVVGRRGVVARSAPPRRAKKTFLRRVLGL
ncbi:hypothetical protein [Streptomyces sp. NPDC018059]|uniref:hypothetical protein n=1 Tax=Streptomyces sp. NPDC018059 TaxID=3365041 RepID=UPI00378BE9B7